MTILEMTELFKWMTIINLILFLVSFAFTSLLKNLVLKIHSSIFGLTKEQISIALYSLFGIYKIILITFVVVPYIALLVIQ